MIKKGGNPFFNIYFISMSKEKQLKINNEIIELVNERKDSNQGFSKNELKFLEKYSGAGGIDKSTRGALYEFYTPWVIIEKMWGLAFKHGFENGRIMEPACGTGRFFRYINPEINTVDAYEFSKDNDISYQIAKACYPWVNITFDYFESYFYSKNYNRLKDIQEKYDLVIGNPPYGKFTGFYANKKMELKDFSGTSYPEYFIHASMKILKPGGLIVFIMPSSFLQKDGIQSLKFKGKLANQAELIEAYRLPYGAFDFTQINTDIIVLRKNS